MFVVDASALFAVFVGLIAALPAYSFTHQSRRGRARSAIAYLSGLAAGIVAAVVLFQVLQTLTLSMTFGEATLAGSFFGPFVGSDPGSLGAIRRKGCSKKEGPGVAHQARGRTKAIIAYPRYLTVKREASRRAPRRTPAVGTAGAPPGFGRVQGSTTSDFAILGLMVG